MPRMKLGAAVTAAVMMMATAALAHITVAPAQSKTGAQETYTFNVPTEGAVTTVGVELEIPAGVEVVKPASSAAYQVVEENGRASLVRWTVDIAAGQAKKVTLVAKNPASGERIQWKVHQLFADGSRIGWVEERGSRRPAPVTTLAD